MNTHAIIVEALMRELEPRVSGHCLEFYNKTGLLGIDFYKEGEPKAMLIAVEEGIAISYGTETTVLIDYVDPDMFEKVVNKIVKFLK